MYFKIIKNNVIRTRVISLILVLFIAIGTMLFSNAICLVTDLTSAMEELMDTAKTPHFMQMHSGSIDLERIQSFVVENEFISESQIQALLNFDGSEIIIDGESLKETVQDNAFVKQNESFDFLLDTNNNIINVSDGEIYLPLCYRMNQNLQIGDVVEIKGENYDKKFRLMGYLRDSQMNSMMASSKRLLISDRDWEEVSRHVEEREYLIEFRLHNESEIGLFEVSYLEDGLEANGPTITTPLFQFLNAISDGILAAALIGISILMVLIALFCIRFTLIVRIQDEYREIGIMKVLGMSKKEITRIFLASYTAFSAFGCVTGFLLSMFTKRFFEKNMRMYLSSTINNYSLLWAVLASVIIFLMVNGFVMLVLKRMKKISAVDALQNRDLGRKNKAPKLLSIADQSFMEVNILLGLRDVWIRKKMYMLLFFIYFLSIIMILVPQALAKTAASKEFITYMGVGECDMRIDLAQGKDLKQRVLDVNAALDQETEVLKKQLFVTASYKAYYNDGMVGNLKVESGNHTLFPLTYQEGREPIAENEIAFSELNAKEYGKKIGDTLVIEKSGKKKELLVCGIYQDVTNGGKTAKATFDNTDGKIMWYMFCVSFKDTSSKNELLVKFQNLFPDEKVTNIDHYMDQTLGNTIDSLKRISQLAMVISGFISALITVLYLKMLFSIDGVNNAVLQAIGFQKKEIERQYFAAIFTILLCGMISGTFFTVFWGERIAGIVLGIFGLSNMKFLINPWSVYSFGAFLLMIIVSVTVVVGMKYLNTNEKFIEKCKEWC